VQSDANNPNDNTLDLSALIWGLLMGLVIGGVAALFYAPRSGNETRQLLAESEQNLREKIEATVIPVDPVAEGMAEGKAAARRRRAELGLDNNR
jgi:gas vesicle protein